MTDAERPQRVGEAIGESAKIGEGVGVGAGPYGDARAASFLDVAIDDVAREIELVGNFEIAARHFAAHSDAHSTERIRSAAAFTARTMLS